MTTFRIRDIFILGFMNFALFVGAGNIIFPPFIGLQAGTAVWPAAAGFLLTGVGLPVVTAIAMAGAGGSMAALTRPVGHLCGILLTVICYLCVGPLFATPRTATVSYELALQPFTGSERWLPLWSAVYYGVVVLVSLHPGRLLDTVGKVLSPIKIVALIILAVTALFLPAGSPQEPAGAYATAAFSQGLTNGYLTMDTLAALVFGLVIVGAIRSRGVTSLRLVTRYAVLSGLIAGAGLALVYLSLFRLGTGSTGLTENAANGAQVLGAYVRFSYGAGGGIFLGALITLACLVTAIGLTCACAGYFSSITRISYRVYAWLFAGFSMLVSNLGLTQLISISVPVLIAIYPVFVVLIVTFFFRSRLRSSALVVAPTALVAFLFGAADALEAVGISMRPFTLTRELPLHHQGLAWLLPALAVMVIAALADRVVGVAKPEPLTEKMMAFKKTGKSAVNGAVLYPCLVAMAAVLFIGFESLIWYTGNSYPRGLAQVRYVDDDQLLTPQAMRDICGLPLTPPELVQKQNGLYLRCGVPGLEGIYRIEPYETQKKVRGTFIPAGLQ